MKEPILNLNTGHDIPYNPWTEEEKEHLMHAIRYLHAMENKKWHDILYIPEFYPKDEADKIIDNLMNLDWLRVDNTPRMEYYCNAKEVPYTYGRGRGIREYKPQPFSEEITKIRKNLERLFKCDLEVCFLNRYENQRDHLGWHADDSPEMDDDRPIIIVTFGVEREIWFKEQEGSDHIEKLTLGHGSVCVMPAHFQENHFHRIPKASFNCGRRISLTFRGYKEI